jgi:hypothetical protein
MMMRTFRGLFYRGRLMKQNVSKYICAIIIMLSFPAGCKESPNILFCEGVSKEEKGVNCGTTFTLGDLTAVITIKEPFDTDRLAINITEKKKYKDAAVNNMSVEANPEKNTAAVNLSFYNEGIYRIKVTGKEDKIIAEGEVTIADTY